MNEIYLDKSEANNEQCFIIMPISDPKGYEPGHFADVYQEIIKPACNAAGYNSLRGDEQIGTHFIHLSILQSIVDFPMAICDLSGLNPNVLFELGLRQAFDKPTVIIQEEGTPQIFDIHPLNIITYKSDLLSKNVKVAVDAIKSALIETKKMASSGRHINSIIKLLSLAEPAKLIRGSDRSDSVEMMQVVMRQMNELISQVTKMQNERDTTPVISGDSKPVVDGHNLKKSQKMAKATKEKHMVISLKILGNNLSDSKILEMFKSIPEIIMSTFIMNSFVEDEIFVSFQSKGTRAQVERALIGEGYLNYIFDNSLP